MGKQFFYKAETRDRLAEAAGVCRQTMDKWIKENLRELKKLGYKPRAVLPPSVVAYLCEKYVITFDLN